MLRGVALCEAEDRLRYFPADELPAAPAARFAALFAARPRWAADDITPFLDGMQVCMMLPLAPLLRETRLKIWTGW